ncbi:hypothetical protein [Nocardioides astragali]|uniref:Restriction endonuclease n=1 Tax=Nocardioides astragali TaxID=1776736 RepID=A0ABW2N4F2_9ACTN|nr:hypothetical protein [Nocardioides astragali]
MSTESSSQLPPLASALQQAGERPPTLPRTGGGTNQSLKKNWAQKFSNALATTVANGLRVYYPKALITPEPDGSKQEYTVGGKVDRKKTDVAVIDDMAGLIAGVSIKTLTFRDTHQDPKTKERSIGRYQRNVKRNDMELRDEADTLHRRQPFAVLTALMFLPEDGCWDGVNGHSSFAHIVFTLRKRTGRDSPEGRFDLFENVYVGLIDFDGNVRFFDVRDAPPKNQPPNEKDTISFDQLMERIDQAVEMRNAGVSAAEKYATPDLRWAPPADSLPDGLENEKPLTLEYVIESAGETEDDLRLFGDQGDEG